MIDCSCRRGVLVLVVVGVGGRRKALVAGRGWQCDVVTTTAAAAGTSSNSSRSGSGHGLGCGGMHLLYTRGMCVVMREGHWGWGISSATYHCGCMHRSILDRIKSTTRMALIESIDRILCHHKSIRYQHKHFSTPTCIASHPIPSNRQRQRQPLRPARAFLSCRSSSAYVLCLF